MAFQQRCAFLLLLMCVSVVLPLTTAMPNLFSRPKKQWQIVYFNSSLDLSCRLTDPSLDVVLRRSYGSEQFTERVPDGKKVTKFGQIFTINNLEFSDRGNYECLFVFNGRRTGIRIQSIYVRKAMQDTVPFISVTPPSLTVQAGEPAVFSCQATSLKILSVIWFKDKIELPSSWQKRTQIGNITVNSLKIERTNSSDSGEYECRVYSNDKSGDYWPVRSELLVDFNFVTRFPSVVVKRFGDQWTIDCAVTVPNGTVSLWVQKAHTPLYQLKPDGKKIMKMGQKFILKLLTSNDAGFYKCIATSSVGGTIEKSIRLIPSLDGNLNPEAYAYPFGKVVKVGERVSFSCQALGNNISISWLKNGQLVSGRKTLQLPIKRQNEFVINENILTLKSATKVEQGNYTCKVTSALQPKWQHQRTVELIVNICTANDGSFEDPSNPFGYIQCSNGVEHRRSCPPQTKWDKPSRTCRQIVTSALTWIGQDYEKHTAKTMHSSWQADCRVSNSSIKVELIKEPSTVALKPVTRDGQIFTIHKLAKLDSGTYSCIAPNNPELKKKKLTILSVYHYTANDGLEVDILSGKGNLELDSYDSKEVLCQSRYDGVLQWYRVNENGTEVEIPEIPKKNNKSLLATKKKVVQIKSRKHIADRGGLILSSELLLKKILPEDSGKYVCKKINRFQRSKRRSLRINIKAVNAPSITTNSLLTVTARERVTLTCDVTGSIKPNVTWFKDGIKIGSCTRFSTCSIKRRFTKRYAINKETLALEIRLAKYEDSGKYKCVARNLAGESNGTVYLNIRVKPIITEPESSKLLQTRVTDAAELECVVERSLPRPNITWEYQQWPCLNMSLAANCTPAENKWREIPSKIGQITREDRKGNKNVYKVTVFADSLSSFFRCRAQNVFGLDQRIYAVKRFAVPHVSLERKIEYVDIGETIVVVCHVEGIPKPKIVWRKRGGEESRFLKVAKSTKVEVKDNVLRIKDFTVDNYGQYQCEAQNERGKHDEIVNIIERQPNNPKVGAVASKNNNHQNGTINKAVMNTIIAAACVVVFFVLMVILIILYRRKKLYGGFYIFTLPPAPDYIKKLDPGKSLIEQTHKLPYDPEWEFPRERLKLGRPLGSGQFGQVYLAEATGIVAFDPRGSVKRRSGRRRSRFGSNRNPYVGNKKVSKVAVKLLKEEATESEYKDLMSELKILIHVGEHKNIVNLLGACTKGHGCNVWVIIEYCPHGNMLDFLRMRREVFECRWTTPTSNPDIQLTPIDLVIAAYQVARAMEFLAARKCVHRDLAARNVLVGTDYVVKVADFGLARDIYKEEHYVKTTNGLLPVKWMAIEALVDRIYTHQSDVWSFGIFLWEVFTLGGSPYPGIPANEIYNFLMSGKRMEPPVDCPDGIYGIMVDCWMHAPYDRPTFTQLVERIDKIIEKNEGGAGYLNLENETREEEDMVNSGYLHPQELSPLLQTPSLETFNTKDELPPLPRESIELNEFRKSLEQLENVPVEEKLKFMLDEPPKGKMDLLGVDSEMEKVHRDSMEKENIKEVDLQSGSSTSEEEVFSEKERQKLIDDEDKDLCERTSNQFEYPPPYEERHYKNLPSPTEKGTYSNVPSPIDVGFKSTSAKDRTFRQREPSARYVEGL